jgi:hypothetical protein
MQVDPTLSRCGSDCAALVGWFIASEPIVELRQSGNKKCRKQHEYEKFQRKDQKP